MLNFLRQPDPVRAIIVRLHLPSLLRSLLLLAWDSWSSFGRHRGGETAAAIAYYGLFALFPLMLFILSVAGLVLGTASREADIVQAIANYIPGSETLLQHTISQVLAIRGSVSLVAVVALLWSASGVFTLLWTAINRTWCPDCGQPLWKQRLVGVVITLLVGALMIIALASSGFAHVARSVAAAVLPHPLLIRISLLDWIALATGIITNIAAFFLLYRWLPTVPVPWRAALLGAFVAGLLWELAKIAFTWYLTTFAVHNFTLVYGSLAAVIVLMLWTYLSASIILFGAEVGATYARASPAP
jgi:membrane protein